MDMKALELSLVLTVAGMAVIFVFMGLLIVIVHFFVAFATRYFPDKEGEPQAEGIGESAVRSADSGKVVAAIAAALKQKK